MTLILPPIRVIKNRWARTPYTTILHSRHDEVVPFQDSVELIADSGLPVGALIEVGTEHRLADEESLAKMLEVCEKVIQQERAPSEAER